MPIEINHEEDDDGGFNLFRNITPTKDSRHTNPIIDYNKFGLNRGNTDLRNATGEVAMRAEVDDMGITPPPNVKEGWGEMIRNQMPSNPLDVNDDGVVDSKDMAIIKESSISKIKAVGSSAVTGIGSGLQKTATSLKKGALVLGDVNEDGVVDSADIGAGVRNAGKVIRDSSGVSELAGGLKETADNVSSQLIYVGGGVILLYLLFRTGGTKTTTTITKN